MNKGRCIGGPHDGNIVECAADHFIEVLKVHPDVKEPDGTMSRQVDYDTYRWDGAAWRWGTQ